MKKPENEFCTLTSISQLERDGGENVQEGPSAKNSTGFDNQLFQAENSHSNIETLPAKQEPPSKDEIKFRGLSKNEVVLRCEQPFWSRMRQVFYLLVFFLWVALIVTLITIALIHPKCKAQPSTSWWQGAVYYRIDVPFFKDSNGDCKGDFQGIVSKLDYLKEIGVDAVSLSPIYLQEDKEVEFSITNHTSVNNEYGDIQDLLDLIKAVHKKGMYLVLDFIPNMTGKKHEWFQQSQMSAGRNRKNFYVWANGDTAPNNWNSQTNGSAWSFSPERNATFLHQVDPSLPDLNLRSLLVLGELNEILRYWMSLGIDGFNLRHFGLLLEDYDLRSEPKSQPSFTNDTSSYEYLDHEYTANFPENFHLLRLWRNVVNRFDNKTRIVMAGMDTSGEEVTLYESVYGDVDSFLTPYFIFWDPPKQCSGFCVQNYINGKLREFSTLNSAVWMLGSDTVSRLKSRLENNVKRQEILTMVTFLLPGSVFLYNGDEVNIADNPVTGNWSVITQTKPWRTPMPWDNSSHAGFSNSSCPLSLLQENNTVNVKNELSNMSSMLNFIKNLTRIRKNQGFHIGDFQYGLIDDEVFSFIRGFDGTACFLVAVNLSNQTITRNFASGPGAVGSNAKVRLLTPSSKNKLHPLGETTDTSNISLGGYQGIVLEWKCGLRQ